MVERCCALARRFRDQLSQLDRVVIGNEVVLNQVLVGFGSHDRTDRVIAAAQRDGTRWMGGTTWRGTRYMRIAVSNWSTSDADVGHNLYHLGDICNSGTLCGTGAPGTGTDRSLGDFSSATTDSTGCPFFSFAGNPTGDSNGTLAYVTHQTSNCFAALATNVPDAPLVAGLALTGGGVAAVSLGVRRMRRSGLPSMS